MDVNGTYSIGEPLWLEDISVNGQYDNGETVITGNPASGLAAELYAPGGNISYENTNTDNTFDPGSDAVWIDQNGGSLNKYDAGMDILLVDPGSALTSNAVGATLAQVVFDDLDTNGIYSTNDEVWIEDVSVNGEYDSGETVIIGSPTLGTLSEVYAPSGNISFEDPGEDNTFDAGFDAVWIDRDSGTLNMFDAESDMLLTDSGSVTLSGQNIDIKTTTATTDSTSATRIHAISTLIIHGAGGLSADGVNLDATAGSDITIDAPVTVKNSAALLFESNAGTITSQAQLTGTGTATIKLIATGDRVSVEQPIDTATGAISITAETNIVQTAMGSLTTESADITLTADTGHITMDAAASTNSTGGNVSYQAGSSITVSEIDAGTGNNVTLSSGAGIVGISDLTTDVVADLATITRRRSRHAGHPRHHDRSNDLGNRRRLHRRDRRSRHLTDGHQRRLNHCQRWWCDHRDTGQFDSFWFRPGDCEPRRDLNHRRDDPRRTDLCHRRQCQPDGRR